MVLVLASHVYTFGHTTIIWLNPVDMTHTYYSEKHTVISLLDTLLIISILCEHRIIVITVILFHHVRVGCAQK